MKMYTIVPLKGQEEACIRKVKEIENATTVYSRNKHGDIHIHLLADTEINTEVIKGTVKAKGITEVEALTVLKTHILLE